MAGRRTALLVATDSYLDPAFDGLDAPRQDAAELAGLLGDAEIGGYSTTVLANASHNDVRIALNELFSEAGRDDLLLFYVSGHGVKDEAGNLHLVLSDTRRNLLAATAISARFVRELIDNSDARRVAVWLDCCYAGAFPAGMVPKAEGTVDVVAQLDAGSGRGCAVMTASTHIQYAYERGGPVEPGGRVLPSVFTNAIVAGLRTGAADLNADGEIDAAELYSYVYEQVRLVTPHQTPTRNDQLSGELYIAHSKLGLGLPAGLDLRIRAALRNPYRMIRVGAVRQLGELAHDGDSTALDALQRLANGPDQILADAAVEALAPPTIPAPPTPQEPQGPGARPIAVGFGVGAGGYWADPVHLDFAADPHFLALIDDGFGKTNLLRVIMRRIAETYAAKEAVFLVVDYQRGLHGILDDARVFGYGTHAEQVRNLVGEAEAFLRKRLAENWHGPQLYVVVDDYGLLGDDQPLAPLAAFIADATRTGLHLIVARHTGGAQRALGADPLLRALRATRIRALVGHGDPDEGPLLGRIAPTADKPGFGILVDHNWRGKLVRITWEEQGAAEDLEWRIAAGHMSDDEYRAQRAELLRRRRSRQSPTDS